MWLFCGGMRRGGSTLQFNLACEIVEQSGTGRKIPWIPGQTTFNSVREEYGNEPGWMVIKYHECTPQFLGELAAGNAKALYIYRDLRDVAVSWIEKVRSDFCRLIKARVIEDCIRDCSLWTGSQETLVSRYETVMLDTVTEVQRIAKHLQIELQREDCEAIAEKYALAEQKKRILDLTDRRPADGAYAYGEDVVDLSTLLHANHIRSGQSGQWGDYFTRDQIMVIESIAGDWLRERGYSCNEQCNGLLSRFRLWKAKRRLRV